MNTLKQSATSPDDSFNKEECNKELGTYHHKLFDLQNMFYADGRFSLSKKGASKPSIIVQ